MTPSTGRLGYAGSDRVLDGAEAVQRSSIWARWQRWLRNSPVLRVYLD